MEKLLPDNLPIPGELRPHNGSSNKSSDFDKEKKLIRLNFRKKLLFLFILFSIAPLMIISLVLPTRARKAYEELMISGLSARADLLEQSTLYFLKSNRSWVSALATRSDFFSEMESYKSKKGAAGYTFDSEGKVSLSLLAVRKENAFVEKAYILDGSGTIIVSTEKSEVGRLVNSSVFTRPIEVGETYLGNAVFNSQNTRVIPISTPIRRENGNATAGVLVIEMNSSVVKALMDGSLFNPEQQTDNSEVESYIIDEDGYPLTSVPHTSEEKTVDITPILNCKDNVNNSVGVWKSYYGVDVVGVAKCLRYFDVSWTLLLESPVSSALSAGYSIRNLALFVTMTIVFLVLLVIVSVSRSITKPILQLIKGADRLGHGELDYRIQISSGDELEDLASSFNQMAYQLKGSIYRLTAERNKMEIILSGIKDAVLAVDLNSRIVVFNKAAEKLTGYEALEILGKPIGDVLKIFENSVHNEREINVSEYCPIRKDDYEGVIFSANSLMIKGKNQKSAYINLTVGKIREASVVNLGCILTMQDITNAIQLEEMKVDFVSMAAHELRTPLTSIRGYTDILRDQINEKLTAEEKGYLYRLAISAENLSNLIDNLLNASRIERGAFKIDAIPVDVTNLVRNSLESFEEQVRIKNQTLQFIEPKDPLPLIQADSFKVSQVISNLVVNAINYTGSSGRVEVSISKTDDSNWVTVAVKDTGPGIPEEALPKLFTKFFRVSGKLEAGSKGTGLGLFICKSIIQMHGGKIWVESEVGKGSTFFFTLPVSTEWQKKDYNERLSSSGFVNTKSPGIIRRR